MFYAKTKCFAISELGIRKNFKMITKRLQATKQHEPAVTSVNLCPNIHQPADASLEWQRARPFSELPKEGVFRFTCKFLPGGRYYKLDSNQLERAMHEDFGDIFIVPAVMGRPNIVVTHNPEDFACVFRNEGMWPIRPFATLRYHRNSRHADFYKGTEGVMTTHGEQWSSFRSILNPLLMQPKNVHKYFSKMAQVNQEFVDRIRLIRDSKTLEMPADFEDYLKCWTLESVAVVALDRQLGLLRDDSENSADALEMISALNTIFTLAYDLEWKPSLWRRMPTPKFRRLMQAMDDMHSLSLKYVEKGIARLEAEKQRGFQRSENEKNAFEKLLDIDQKIAAITAMDLLVAGINTTSSMVSGILLCLAKNSEKQEKLRAEVDRVLPQKDGDFTADALENIPYLRACIKESMRVYPLSVGIVRAIQNDVVLSGYRVPKGTMVNLVSSTLLANENYYPRPLEFLPERWLRPSKADDNRSVTEAVECAQALRPSNPFIFLPFGVGPRVCLGRRVSELEVELGIARLVRNFRIEFNYPTVKAFKSMFINMPNIPLKFKFTDIG